MRKLILLAVVILAGCSSDPEPQTSSDTAQNAKTELPSLPGYWHAQLQSPGGPLPFGLEFSNDAAGELSAHFINGAERAEASGVGQVGKRVVVHIDWYDAEISARFHDDGRLEGRWRKTTSEGESSLPFLARKGQAPRFKPLAESAAMDISGSWTTLFTDEDGKYEAIGKFEQLDTQVTGTFLTATGDYRYLAGVMQGDRLRLSTFDGAHAFLFDAKLENGQLWGDFWSRDTYHAKWVARPATEQGSEPPESWSQLSLNNEQGVFRFGFEDLNGKMVRNNFPRFQDKVLLVNLFGTWCPNCNDEAPLLAQWHKQYRDQGLEVVGLAFEYTGDMERDRTMVKRFKKRHGIKYPLLLAGTSDKQDAADLLPDLDQVLSYPTTIFIGRDGKVRDIHSGFSGPGTGSHYEALKTKFETTIETLLAEPAPAE